MAINLNQNNPNNPEGMQTGPQAAGGPQPKQQGTGFTNLKSVLNANKNNKLGQAIGTGVQNISNKTQGQTQQAQNQFAQQIGQSVQDIQKGTKVQQNLSDLDFGKDSEKASQNIQEVGGEEYANAAANLRKGYTGPQGLQNQDALQAQSQQLGQTAQGLMTSGGRQAALQRFINVGPGYTQGKQQLDNMLLGQNQQDISDARRQAAQTAQSTNQAINQAATQGQSTGLQYNTLGQDITGKIQGLGQNLGSALDTRSQQKIQESQTQVADLQNRVRNGSITPEDYDYYVNQILGTEDTYNLSKENLAGMVTANTDYNKSNVINQQELNARDALSRLSGAKSGDEILDLDESKLGTAGPARIRDEQAFNSYIQQSNAAKDAIKNFKFNPVTGTPESGTPENAVNMFTGMVNPDLLKFKAPSSLDYAATKELAATYDPNSANSPGFSEQDLKNQIFSYAGRNRPAPINVGDRAANPFAGNPWAINEQQAAESIDKINQQHYQQQLANAVSQYKDTTKKYGIGNNLRNLLTSTSNKTFGVK